MKGSEIMFLKDLLIKWHFEKPEDRLEDDTKRFFVSSKAGRELLETQQRLYFQTGSFLPDNF